MESSDFLYPNHIASLSGLNPKIGSCCLVLDPSGPSKLKINLSDKAHETEAEELVRRAKAGGKGIPPTSVDVQQNTLRTQLQYITLPNVQVAEPIQTLADEMSHCEIMKGKVEDMIGKGIGYIRRIRGDGNCYYRSVGYAYFELVIKRGEKSVRAMVQLLKDSCSGSSTDTELGTSLIERGQILITGLEIVLKVLEMSTLRKALQSFFLRVSLDCQFDEAIVAFMRKLVYNLIMFGIVNSVNGLSLGVAINATVGNPNKESFCQTVVLSMGENAKSIILYLLPAALKVNVKIFVADRNDKGPVIPQDCSCKLEEYEATRDESLDFSKETISVILRPGHYDLLYAEKDYYKYDGDLNQFCKVKQ